MCMMTVVDGDDWTGIFVDDELLFEDHSIPLAVAVKLAIDHNVTEVQTKYADLEWLAEEGTFPESLNDVIFEE